MKFLTDMVLVDKVSPSRSILSASGGTYAMFSSGKLGMIHSGMWFLGYLSSRAFLPTIMVQSLCRRLQAASR